MPVSKPKVMITGAAGFIATAFWRQFQDKYDLFGVDKYGYASQTDERRSKCITGPFQVVEGDCADFGVVSDALDDAGACYSGYPATYPTVDKLLVLHSETHNDNSLKSPVEFYRSNVIGLVNALEAARRHRIPRVYVVVTDEVLKHWAPAYCDHDEPSFYLSRILEEDNLWETRFNPTSPYSSSKACQEMIVNAYRHSYNMDIVVIRPTNVYGPGQYPEKLISKGITDLLNGKKIQVYGEGAQWRDYTYVSDTCDALDLILSQENPRKLYHISANDERQNISTVKEILNQLDKSEDFIEYIEDPRGKAHDFSYSLSSARIRKLGWAPKVPFEEGISRTIQYYKDKLSER